MKRCELLKLLLKLSDKRLFFDYNTALKYILWYNKDVEISTVYRDIRRLVAAGFLVRQYRQYNGRKKAIFYPIKYKIKSYLFRSCREVQSDNRPSHLLL